MLEENRCLTVAPPHAPGVSVPSPFWRNTFSVSRQAFPSSLKGGGGATGVFPLLHQGR
ncbi:hypothetical protein IF1G_05328 [Cordyceps javanica]|uniref:Uncharacterized protein n=1 Tax=Cordyceps javanica TaxID=43265 RepID=A0A545V1D2_9HYPO|nr:hypothetical protein IF1G_05328 [Cordyceps javanica]